MRKTILYKNQKQLFKIYILILKRKIMKMKNNNNNLFLYNHKISKNNMKINYSKKFKKILNFKLNSMNSKIIILN